MEKVAVFLLIIILGLFAIVIASLNSHGLSLF